MKKLQLIIILLALLLMNNINLYSQTTPLFTTNGAKNYLVDNIYYIMKRNAYHYSFSIPANILSDDAASGTGTTDDLEFPPMDNYTIPTNNGHLGGLWKKYYDGISKCNILLAFTKANFNSEVDRYRAEAQFIRASFYFDLVRLFGGVPLIITADVPLIPNYGRASVAEIYTQIEKDLLDASKVLPPKSNLTVDEKFRATNGAAHSLLGKVYLFEQKWQLAADQFTLVINSGEYSLLSKFSDLWVTNNKFSSESILEYYYFSSAIWNDIHPEGNQDVRYMSFRGSSGKTYNSGWGFCPITQNLIDAFNSQGDTVRLNATVLNESVLLADGCKILAYDSRDYTGYFNKKYSAIRADMRNNYESNKDEIVLRYADVLLMYAEAQNKLGNDTESQKYLNMVRNRVNLNNITSTGSTLSEAIQKERRLELAMEGSRFFDLVRWGKAESDLASLGYKSYNNVWPIPQAEIDKNKNLTQNPGYSGSGTSSKYVPGIVQDNFFSYYKSNLDSIIKYQYNISKSDSIPFSLITYVLRGSGDIVDAKYSEWDYNVGKWVESYWAIDSLTPDNKLHSGTQYNHNFIKSTTSIPYWDTIIDQHYTYNSKNYETSYTYYNWLKIKINGAITKMWYPMYKYIYFPDEKGNDSSVYAQQYDLNTGQYYTSRKTRYQLTYSSNGKVVTSVSYTTMVPDTIDYTKYERIEYKYDDKDNLIQRDHYYWDGSYWNFNDSYKKNLAYDNNNQVISDITQNFDNASTLYINSTKAIYVLDTLNEVKVSSVYRWDIGFEDWWIGDGKFRTFYYYNNVPYQNNNNSPASNNLKVSILPNPVYSQAKIYYELPNMGNVNLQLLSVDGKVARYILLSGQRAGKNNYSLDVANIENGLYFLTVRSGNLYNVQKMVIKK
jgi:starch-binding outer membrane protein, SusD/RagB family